LAGDERLCADLGLLAPMDLVFRSMVRWADAGAITHEAIEDVVVPEAVPDGSLTAAQVIAFGTLIGLLRPDVLRDRDAPRSRRYLLNPLVVACLGQTAQLVALSRIAALYAIEAGIRGASPGDRLTERRVRSRPLVEDLFAWLEAMLAKLPACSTMAEAIRYALNHRDGLLRFLDDGCGSAWKKAPLGGVIGVQKGPLC
jgi:hypothetical protein